MRQGRSALAALVAVVLTSSIGASATGADGDMPLRMKLEVADGKTCPPPNARTEVRLRVQGGTWTRSPSAGQTDAPGSISLLSYCPASAEPRTVVHTAYYVGEDSAEPNGLTATMQRAAQPMPVRGKLAPPRPSSKAGPVNLYGRESQTAGSASGPLASPRPDGKRATAYLFSDEASR